MSLSAAFNVISSSFAANAAQTAVVSNNIANVNTPGYSRQIANVVTSPDGGVDVASVTREANAALSEQAATATAQAAASQAIAAGLARARADGQRQFLGLHDIRRGPERRLAIGDARQSRKRARNLSNVADIVFGGRRGRDRGAERRCFAEHRQRGGRNRPRTGRSGHGLVGRHDQHAPWPVHRRQQRGRQRPSDRGQRCERRGPARL